jgi:hypothetical protein
MQHIKLALTCAAKEPASGAARLPVAAKLTPAMMAATLSALSKATPEATTDAAHPIGAHLCCKGPRQWCCQVACCHKADTGHDGSKPKQMQLPSYWRSPVLPDILPVVPTSCVLLRS